MPINWKPFVDLVKDRQRFLLTTHIRPDPDGLGSMLGMAEVLEQQGKHIQMVIASNWPPRYNFLDAGRRIERFALPGDAWRDAEVIVILDTGTWGQLGDFGKFLPSSSAAKVVIDHHVSQDDLSALQLVDTSAEATGRLVYEAIQALGVELPQSAAHKLFAAVATDTGWFRHSNTTSATFALAEKLVQAGAQPTPLYEHLYEQNSLPRLKLMGLVLDRLQVTSEGQVAYTEVRRDDYSVTGAVPQDTEDLINFCRSVAGVEVAAFFMEQPAGGVKVSFRSRQHVDVASLAEQFGGGGHRRASGTIIHQELQAAKDSVLTAIAEALAKSSENDGK